MATIYRFIVEQKTSGGSSGGRKSSSESSGISKKGAAKKGRWVSILGGEKGGVEHNRKLRAINPLINKATGGYWEKGMRVGRATMGLVQENSETGKFGLSFSAIAILIAFAIQTVLKIQNKARVEADKRNARNFKAMENGFGTVHGEYNVSVNFWDGQRTFNENK